MNAMTNNIYYNPGTHTVMQHETDYVQECLVERDNQEIMQKYLRGEQLTEEESKTVADCVAEKKASEDTATIIGGAIGAMLILGFLIFLIATK